jgi:hypothetical protein
MVRGVLPWQVPFRPSMVSVLKEALAQGRTVFILSFQKLRQVASMILSLPLGAEAIAPSSSWLLKFQCQAGDSPMALGVRIIPLSRKY